MITKNENGQLVKTETVVSQTIVNIENVKASIAFHREHVERHTKLLEQAEAMYKEALPIAEELAKEAEVRAKEAAENEEAAEKAAKEKAAKEKAAAVNKKAG